jgi:hypothetical protein
MPEDYEQLQKAVADLKESVDQMEVSLFKKTGSGSNDIQGAKIQSTNFLTGVRGWCLTPSGDLEANNGTFRGNLVVGGLWITMDNTGNIQTNINTLNTAGGGTLYLKSGTYTQSTALTLYSNVKIVGVSSAATIIDFGSTASNLSLAGTSVYTTGTLAVNQGSTSVTGSGTTWTVAMIGQEIFISNRWYTIVNVGSTTTLTLATAFADANVSGVTYRIATPVVNWGIYGVQLKSSTGTALAATDVHNFELNDVLFLSNNKGFVLTNFQFGEVNRTVIFSSTSNGYELTNGSFNNMKSVAAISNGGSGAVWNNVKSCSALLSAGNSNTADGYNLTTVTDCNFLLEVSGNGSQGIECVSGCNANNFDQITAAGNTSDNIKLTATSDNNTISFGSITFAGGYGVNIAAASCDNNLILGCYFASNTTAAANNSGTGTLIRSNIGLADN